MNDLTHVFPVDPQTQFHERNMGRIAVGWKAALIVIAVCAAVSLLWSAFAPLTKAAIAPGVVEVEGRRRTVQNLEGGIIAELLVREGQRVTQGQPLVRLSTVQSGAQAESLRAELLAMLAERQRLLDETRGGALTSLPEELAETRGDPRTQEMLAGQRDLLRSRRESLEAQRVVLRETASQARSEIDGRLSELAGLQSQAASLRAELPAIETLVAEKLERRSRLNELRRQIAAVEGQIGSINGRIGTARRQVAEANARMATLFSQRSDENQTRLREVEMRLNDLRERARAAADVQKRRTIEAPTDGRVVQLRYSTLGGVVPAAEPIMDIVPDRQELIVMARVRPIDIERIHPGLSSDIRLVSFSGRDASMLHGEVLDVSADAINPQDGSDPYYAVRVRIDDPDEIARLNGKIVSGMPAEVFISLGARSLLQALFQPLTESFRRALRE